MVEETNKKQKTDTPKQDTTSKSPKSYTINEVFKITDDFFHLVKEKEYPIGAFVHGLILTLELTQKSYQIPPQQLAEIKRDCRRYVEEIIRLNNLKKSSDLKKE
ncbi:MAG: hypothetical protein BV458_05120 [Thermoplasmata archaeon M9B2D]|nr:MAG: hypothetical protein BV458_05120 [Thermoplasmata archaeon M9B2D]